MEKPLALIIEDDKHLAQAFAEALEDAEYQTEVINDGQTAMTRLMEIIPATVVLDLHIPHIPGDRILHYIRSEARLQQVRVIVATADDLRAQALLNDANLILLKPIGYQQLRDLSARLRPKTDLP